MSIIPYTGNGAYCYSNSLHMILHAASATPNEVPEPAFLECLATMPFGNLYLALEHDPLVFFSSPIMDPDQGLTRAIKTLGWTCQERRGDEEDEALALLSEAVQRAPVLVGPVDLGYLSYNPGHRYLAGADHFVVVLAVESDHVLIHDPQGYPCAILSLDEFLPAWRADRIDYRTAPYTFRANFQQVEHVSRQEMITHTLPTIKANIEANPGGPVAYGSTQALHLLAKNLRGTVPTHLVNHLLHFALPLAARRTLDASAFLQEAGKEQAATCLQQKALLFGTAQYHGAHQQWMEVASIIEQLAELEDKLLALL
jgi:hypothetical protein